jgi:hypothetical protein
MNADLLKGLEPLLNPNFFSRLRHVELLPEVEWNSQCRDLVLALMRVDAAETTNDNVLAISQKMASNHAFVGAVTPEIKEIYPILMACKSVLESVITSSSLVVVSSIVVGLFLRLAHDEYRNPLHTLCWLSCGRVHVR